MLITALMFLSCQSLVFACFCLLAARFYHREARKLRDDAAEAVRQFVEAPDENTPSPLAAMCDQLALLLAARLVQQVKAMLAGVESGASKGEQLALMDEAMAQSPWLGLIGGMLPKRVRNSLMRNPQMVAALSRIGGNNHGVTNEGATAPRRHNRD